MASPEPSPKRQRLSPPDDRSPSFVAGSIADSAYASSTASQVNGTSPHLATGVTSAPAAPLATVPEAEETTMETQRGSGASGDSVKKEESESPADHRRTDHERIAEDDDHPSATENLPFLCKKPYPLSRPHPTQDLVSLYSLSSLAATVARRDAATGAKINKLRKSYEGKVKKQDLPGRNKPTIVEGELMGFMEWPEEGWFDQRIYGRELEHALDPARGRLFRPEDGGPSKLDRALAMLPGRLPRDEDDKWRATLALDDPAAKPPVKQPPLNPLLHRPGLAGATGLRASAPSSPRMSPGAADRPDRAGKKRRYDDASFEGYEAWAEDDGYSTSGGGKGGKRRRVSVGVQ